MIKVNLLKNSGGSSNLNTSMTGMTDVTLMSSGSDESSPEPKKIILKLGIALILPLLVVIYDYYMKSIKQAELDQLNAQITATKKEIASYGDKAESVKRFQNEKSNLERRIGIIKNLSGQRLRVVKTLDALHEIIPEKAWLNRFTVESNRAKVVGRAADDSVVSNIIQNLDESIYFTNVRLESSEEAKSPEGKIRKFIINSGISN